MTILIIAITAATHFSMPGGDAESLQQNFSALGDNREATDRKVGISFFPSVFGM